MTCINLTFNHKDQSDDIWGKRHVTGYKHIKPIYVFSPRQIPCFISFMVPRFYTDTYYIKVEENYLVSVEE